MRTITRRALVFHEIIWIVTSAFFLYISQWYVRSLLRGYIDFTVLMAVLPWLYFMVSSAVTVWGFSSENQTLFKYFMVYGSLRSLYLVYGIYRGFVISFYPIVGVFSAMLLFTVYALYLVRNAMMIADISEEYDQAMTQYEQMSQQPSPIMSMPEPVYTPPPPEPEYQPPLPPSPEPSEWTCPQCGKVNEIRYQFCGECGNPRP